MLLSKQQAIADLTSHIDLLSDENILNLAKSINHDINNDGKIDANDFIQLFVQVTNMDLSSEESTLQLLDVLNPVFDKLNTGVTAIYNDPANEHKDKKALFKAVLLGTILCSPTINSVTGVDVSTLTGDILKAVSSSTHDKALKRKALTEALSPVILKGLGKFLPQFKGVFSLLSLVSKFKM